MDNQSSDSEQSVEIRLSQTKKPNNRNKFTHKGLCLSSDFAGGNLQGASFQQQFRLQGNTALVVQFWGNSDAQTDPLDKSWFCFTVSGIKDSLNMKYQQIIFRFKNANNYRKFIRQKRYKPYVLVKQEIENIEGGWFSIFISKINILQNQVIEAEFVYSAQPGVDKVTFAQNIPYNLVDIESLHQRNMDYLSTLRNSKIYYHRQVIAQSVDNFPVYLCTITSTNNISSYEQTEPDLWKSNGVRSYLLKNKPQIVITSRVHPSQTSSSYCVEGIIQALIKNTEFQILLDVFIFRIVPMINVDGVQNGHYRLDNYLQNLNRYYGHSDIVKTPPIYAIQKLISYLRDKSKLFIFIDIHGHNSPKPSFIFGNFCQHFHQSLENKTFVKILQIASQGNFDSYQCEFSKRNMTVKQKYDEHSKQASARVFAYRGNSQQQNNHLVKSQLFVEHSYTLEVHPYVIQNASIRKNMLRKVSNQMSNSYKNLPKAAMTVKKTQSFNTCNPPSGDEIMHQYKRMGENTLTAIMELIGVNINIKWQQIQQSRKRIFKQISKLPQFYQRSRKYKSRQITRQMLDRYCQKWNILEGYRQYLAQHPHILQHLKLKSKTCPIHQIYEQWISRKQRMEEVNAKRIKYMQKQAKEKQKQKQKGLQKMQCSLEQLNQNQQVLINNQQTDIRNIEQEQQEQQKYTFISYSKQTSNQLDSKKGNVLKTVQFQLVQKIQKEDNKIKDGYKLMSFNNPARCSSPQKRVTNSRVTDISELEKKIRKIIFRHKTQSQIADCEDELSKRNKSPFNIPHHPSQQKNNDSDQMKMNKMGYLKQIEKQYLGSKLEPLTKQKASKLIYMKTEQNRYEKDFNDRRIIDTTEQKGRMSEKKPHIFDQSSNPRIQELMRKITKHKLELQTIMYQSNNQQMESIKQKKTNEILTRQKKSNSRGAQKKQSESRNKIIHGSERDKNPMVFQSNMVLPPMYPLITQEETMSHSENGIMMQGGRLTGCHKSVKSKLKKVDIIRNKASQQQIHDIVKSFRVLAGESNNRLQFVQKAKKMLSQKKRQFKTVQQHNLPTISELEYRGALQKRNKY